MHIYFHAVRRTHGRGLLVLTLVACCRFSGALEFVGATTAGRIDHFVEEGGIAVVHALLTQISGGSGSTNSVEAWLLQSVRVVCHLHMLRLLQHVYCLISLIV
jgi:hypothetical protein